MIGLNKVFLIGNLGQEPELRATPSGLSLLKLSLATKHSRKVDNQWVDGTDWHRLTVFGKQADYVARTAHKGDAVAVEATIRQKKWTDKEGKTHYDFDLLVERVLWVASPKRAGLASAAPIAVDEAPEEPAPPAQGVDEIPF